MNLPTITPETSALSALCIYFNKKSIALEEIV